MTTVPGAAPLAVPFDSRLHLFRPPENPGGTRRRRPTRVHSAATRRHAPRARPRSACAFEAVRVGGKEGTRPFARIARHADAHRAETTNRPESHAGLLPKRNAKPILVAPVGRSIGPGGSMTLFAARSRRHQTGAGLGNADRNGPTRSNGGRALCRAAGPIPARIPTPCCWPRSGPATTMTLRLYANQKSWPLDAPSVAFRTNGIHARRLRRVRDEGRHPVWTGSPGDHAVRAAVRRTKQRLVQIAERCPCTGRSSGRRRS